MKMCSALGRADAVEDHRAGLLLPAPEDVGRQRLARRDAGAHAGEIARPVVERHELRGIERRHAEIERRLEALDVLEGRVGRRPAVVEHRRAAGPQREGHAVAEPIGEEQLGRRVGDVVLADAQHAHAVELAGHHHVALGMDRALGPAGRARGIEPEAIVGRRREPRLELVGDAFAISARKASTVSASTGACFSAGSISPANSVE